MHSPAAGPTSLLSPRRQPKPPECDSTGPDHRPAYGRAFWFAYAANGMVLIGIALLFRYADFITLLGGTEFHLGWIVGVGIAGSIVTRLTIGSWIDRYGARPLWIGSLLLFAATCLAHLTVASHAGAAVYLLRISYTCAVAGINGASMTFVSGRGPVARMAEMVGMLGTAGFLSTVLGTLLGDLLFGSGIIGRPQIVQMFVVAAASALLAIPLVWEATRGEHVDRRRAAAASRRRDRDDAGKMPAAPTPALADVPSAVKRLAESPSMLTLFRRHNPGLVLTVGVAMGIGLGLPTTFLCPFAAELHIPRIGLFFTIYAITAIITRVVTRRWAERYGPRPLILLGLAGLTASIALFLPVVREWHLVLPAIGFGFSHAILFPSVVAEGSGAFPVDNRGMATLLMLATWDLGLLIGSPMAGGLLRVARLSGLPPYPTMYLVTAGVIALIGVVYAASVVWVGRPSLAGILGQFDLLPPKKYHRSPLPEPKESVDFSAVSGSNIVVQSSGPAAVGQAVPAPSPAGGGSN